MIVYAQNVSRSARLSTSNNLNVCNEPFLVQLLLDRIPLIRTMEHLFNSCWHMVYDERLPGDGNLLSSALTSFGISSNCNLIIDKKY